MAAESIVPQQTTDTGSTTRFQPMPDLNPEQYESLRADIEARGIIVPVVLDQYGRTLDGHNRQRIAAELGIACPTEVRHVADDDEAADLAVILNCARRHLTREQVRALVASEAARRPDDSDRAIARRVGCSPSTVASVLRPQVSNLDTSGYLDPFDRLQFRTAADGREFSRDEGMFVLYLALLHSPDLAVAENGALLLTCGGYGCAACEVAVDGKQGTVAAGRAAVAALESTGGGTG